MHERKGLIIMTNVLIRVATVKLQMIGIMSHTLLSSINIFVASINKYGLMNVKVFKTILQSRGKRE